MTIAEMIRAARERLGWSQADLARRLGVTKSAVGNWEKGVSAPKRRRAEQVAKVLGLSPSAINPTYDLGLEHVDVNEARTNIPLMDLSSVTELILQDLSLIQDVMPVLAASLSDAETAVAFKVDTDQMSPEIRRGDIIIASLNTVPRADDLVLCLIGSQVVLRRYRPRGADSSGFQAFDLISPNPDLPTVTVNSSNPGKVLATVVQHHRMRPVHS